MDAFLDSTLSAYFPGLVDVCVQDDGQLAYAILKDGELFFSPEYSTETESFSIPDKKHFPFTLPRAAEVLRYFGQEDKYLYDDIVFYLKRFCALDDEQWPIVAHYALLTYLHDHTGIDYCPYLLFHAVPERGKSRIGKSITYIAFRGIHLIELREPMIFRYTQNLHGTLFFDLMDISKKAERNGCDDILLLRAEKGAKCSRVQHPEQGPFNDTVYYDIYGPTIIASNEPLQNILETRCLPIIMQNSPGNYENPRPELFIELKERLTAWRARHLSTSFDEVKPIEGISGRLWDLSKPLFLVNSLLSVDSSILESSLLAIAGEKDESRKDTVEGRLIAIIKEITDESALDQFIEWNIKTNDIRTRYNDGRPEDKRVSSQWIGKRLKRMSFHNRIVRGYSEIVLTLEEYDTILKQYGYAGRESANSAHSLPKKDQYIQTVLKEVENGRESAKVSYQSTFNSPEEREFYFETLDRLQKEGMPRNKAVDLAHEELEKWRKADDIPF